MCQYSTTAALVQTNSGGPCSLVKRLSLVQISLIANTWAF